MERPPCFGNPIRAPECEKCAVRLQCYREQVNAKKVFLLPRPRVPVRDRKEGSPYVRTACPT